ncbi:type II toxin-antitoxin system HicB family antitoxin [Methanohalophilus halophilus]|uniref:Predicted nuclease of the RNAse H fold, HicB family n=2 Tax=Methanohalophilus halophilus TaxID=2177 RepID=A0A1H2R6U8_9EURY|nr:type II toxin-antitoxin system HicB family antitoxin [Methanohalophilus halophilus]SDW15091.1 Predicted nuclease of the RNAse H fold, HicB family [Methanohalophilus halophilus]
MIESMLLEYIQTALARAKYDIIEDDEEPYYGEISELEGVWATGTSLEECRKNLEEIIGEWLILRLRRNLPIPPLGNFKNCDHR